MPESLEGRARPSSAGTHCYHGIDKSQVPYSLVLKVGRDLKDHLVQPPVVTPVHPLSGNLK